VEVRPLHSNTHVSPSLARLSAYRRAPVCTLLQSRKPRTSFFGRRFLIDDFETPTRVLPLTQPCPFNGVQAENVIGKTIVVPPNVYCVGRVGWNLSLDAGLVRLVVSNATRMVSTQNFVVYSERNRPNERDFFALVASISSLISEGDNKRWNALRQKECTTDDCAPVFERTAISNPSALAVDCGPITWFAQYAISKYTTVPVRFVSTFVDPSHKDPDGHSILEVNADFLKGEFDPEIREHVNDSRWIVVDVDRRVVPTDRYGRAMDAVQFVAAIKSGFRCFRPQYHTRPLDMRDTVDFSRESKFFYERYGSGAISLDADLVELKLADTRVAPICACYVPFRRDITKRRCSLIGALYSAHSFELEMTACTLNASVHFMKIANAQVPCTDSRDFRAMFYESPIRRRRLI